MLAGEFPFDLMLSAMIWTLVVAVVGFFWFRAAEEQYARD